MDGGEGGGGGGREARDDKERGLTSLFRETPSSRARGSPASAKQVRQQKAGHGRAISRTGVARGMMVGRDETSLEPASEGRKERRRARC